MGRITLTIVLIFCFLAVKSQTTDDIMNTNFIYKAEFKYKISAITVQKRFKWSGTHKKIKSKAIIKTIKRPKRTRYKVKELYSIDFMIGEQYKKFKILGMRFYCLPKKIRKEL